MEARDLQVRSNNANSAIALYPIGNASGSWRLFHLSNGEIITRSQLTVLPMSEVVITRMHEYHSADEEPKVAKARAKQNQLLNYLI
jgi:hypothetical protein